MRDFYTGYAKASMSSVVFIKRTGRKMPTVPKECKANCKSFNEETLKNIKPASFAFKPLEVESAGSVADSLRPKHGGPGKDTRYLAQVDATKFTDRWED